MIDFNLADRQGKPSNVTELPAVRKTRVMRAVQLRIRDLVRTLYPHATGLKGDTARIGGLSGEAGQSLAIALSPIDSAGLWKEFNEGGGVRDSGDVFDLYALANGMTRRDLPRIVDELDAWCGGSPPAYVQKRHEALAAKPPPPVKHEEIVNAFPYLSSTGEKLFETCRIEYRDDAGNKVLRENGKPEKIYRPRRLDGSWGYPPGQWSLYRVPDIDRTQDVVLVEGEPCADALNGIGITATTAPGGSSVKPDKIDWRPLAGKNVILWPDNDVPGIKFMNEIAAHLRTIGCTVRLLAPPPGKPEKWDAADAVAEAFDVVGFLKAPVEPVRPLLPILDVQGLLSVPDPTWIIDGWVIDDGASVWYGPPKTYKTFNVLDMALSVACGVPWRGNAVVQQPVLYLLGEGMGTFKYRVHVWLAKRSEGRQARFWTIPVGVPLSTPEGLANAIAAIDSLPVRPGLIVVDTLNRHFGPGDENSSQDMTRFVQSVDALRAHTRAHIAVVHHSGKDAEKGARGSSALLGAVDNEFRITRTEGTKICRIECTAARHSDEPKPMTVELIAVEVTNPETGLVMSSLLPVLREDMDEEKGGKPERKSAYSGAYAAILKMLQDAPLSTWEVADKLGVDRSNAGKKLRVLEQDGAVFSRDEENRKVWIAIAHTLPTGNE